MGFRTDDNSQRSVRSENYPVVSNRLPTTATRCANEKYLRGDAFCVLGVPCDCPAAGFGYVTREDRGRTPIG